MFYAFLVYGNYYTEIKRLNDSKSANYGFIILIIAKPTTNDNIQNHFYSIRCSVYIYYTITDRFTEVAVPAKKDGE